MEIINKKEKGFIEVWMTNEEQNKFNREKLTHLLLTGNKTKKCMVVFYMSGNSNLLENTENLLISNLGCV